MTTANDYRQDAAARMERIEQKIDQMSDAIIALARAEEKITTLTSFGKQQAEQTLTLINRVDRIENLVVQNATTVNIINKIFWVVITAMVAGVTGMLFLQ